VFHLENQLLDVQLSQSPFLFLLLLSVTIDFFLTVRKQGHKKMSNRKKSKKPPPLPLILPTDDNNGQLNIM
jgi:hypothetical protein